MRVALVPLDSRPPNWLFPQRLAEIAGVKLELPPRELLGTLHRGADGLALARWLRDAVMSPLGEAHCQAAVFSWDALLYGGLIQSRQLDAEPRFDEAAAVLRQIDWGRVAGYCYATVPRLGISVASSAVEGTHALVREYFISWGRRDEDPRAAERVRSLEQQLGPEAIEALWSWRTRNHQLARRAILLSCELGLRLCHVATEDNAKTGPHLAETEQLRRAYLEARRDYPRARCTFFDGADECAALLLARAVADGRSTTARPLQLSVHPAVPGPDRYTGLYESHSLGDGLTMLARLLNLSYGYEPQEQHWLVVHGVQPQPDVFATPPDQAFNNPFLLPKAVPPGGRLLLSDLCACNGANPWLVTHLAALRPDGLRGLVGFNTNFNTLGLSAAWLRLSRGDVATEQRFLLERLADDVVYQSLARPAAVKYLRQQDLDPLDFASASSLQRQALRQLVADCWRDWREGDGAAVLAAAGISAAAARQVSFSFPWSRTFEIEATAKL